MEQLPGSWTSNFDTKGATKSFICGYCGHNVATKHGTHAWHNNGMWVGDTGYVRICPHCNKPTFLSEMSDEQAPGPLAGRDVSGLPGDIASLYRDIRKALASGAYTAAVLTARKLLMHVAVSKGAPTNAKFIVYVRFLVEKGYVPPNGDTWLSYIVKRSNEENHEIQVANQDDALALLTLTEHLLRSIFELPGLVPAINQP